MPAKFHPVSPSVWDQTMHDLGVDAKVVRLYLLTCNHRLSEGLFDIKIGHIVTDTGLSAEVVGLALEELEHAGLINYDASVNVVLDRTALKYSPLRNGKSRDGVIKQDARIPGAVRLFENVPDTPLKAELYRLAARYSPDLKFALGERFPDLTFAVEGDIIASESRFFEGASDSPQAPSEAFRAPSRGEPVREEVRAGIPSGVQPAGACAVCGEVAFTRSDGTIDYVGGRPKCNWCVTSPAMSPV
jgi:hypothetical protein